ncbi:MAG: hypothetical protein ACLFVJ_16375 [Persicimonas sp.]
MNWKKTITLLASLAAVAAFSAACGDDDGNNGGGTLTAQEFEDQASDAFASSLCASSYQCTEEQDPNLTTFASRFETEEACTDGILASLGFGFEGNITGGVEQGLAEFNADKARECIDAIDELTSDACFNIFSAAGPPTPACDEVVTGLQPAGAACDSDDHCASGSCDFSVDTDDACWAGECAETDETDETVIRSEGESCAEDNEYCDPDAGLACDVDEDDNRVCVALDSRAEGAACASANVCNDGLACVEDTCTELELGAEGDSCDMQATFCEAGLVCGFSIDGGAPSGSCMPPKDQGEECIQDVSCKVGLQCDGADMGTMTAGTCEPTLAAGEDCESNFDCQEGLECANDGTCADPDDEVCEIPTDSE